VVPASPAISAIVLGLCSVSATPLGHDTEELETDPSVQLSDHQAMSDPVRKREQTSTDGAHHTKPSQHDPSLLHPPA
jgi:hypothetical protein